MKIIKQLGFEHLPMMTGFLSKILSEELSPYQRSKAIGIVKNISDYTEFITQPLTKGIADEHFEKVVGERYLDFEIMLDQLKTIEDAINAGIKLTLK